MNKPNPKKNPDARRARPQVPSFNQVRMRVGPKGLGNNKYDAQTGKKWPEPKSVTVGEEEKVEAAVEAPAAV